MKSLGLVGLLTLTGVAFADAPPGRYRLDGGSFGPVGPPRQLLPSCGSKVIDFITSLGQLAIVAGDSVTVNGDLWPPGFVQLDGKHSVERTDVLEGYVVHIEFGHHEASADGLILVIRSGDGVQCGDSRRYSGKYRR